MNYEIFTDGEGSYLRVVIEGEIDVKDLDTLDEKLRHAARQHGIPALLIDVRKARNVSQKPKIVEYGREPAVASAGFPREWPRVVLVDPTDRSHDFIVDSLRFRGHRVSLSRDESAAVEWLCREMERTPPL